MSNYKYHAIEKLKSSGLRITLARKSILEILDVSQKALSVAEIMELLAQEDKSVDKVSVYRILECLEEHKLIHKTLSTGKVVKCSHYEHSDTIECADSSSHHLFTCKKCGKITEIEQNFRIQLPSNVGFTITDYNLEFMGYCHSCKD